MKVVQHFLGWLAEISHSVTDGSIGFHLVPFVAWRTLMPGIGGVATWNQRGALGLNRHDAWIAFLHTAFAIRMWGFRIG